MFRYLGMVWDDTNPQQQETAQLIAERLRELSSTWRQEFSAPGMQVFCAGVRDDALQLHRVGDHGGIVIGSLLARSRDLFSATPDQQFQFGATQSHEFVQSRGKWLIDHAWGDYVAFGYDANGYKWVLKDPTGSLPCLRTEYRGVSIFFSRIGDCLDLRLLRFTANETFLRCHMMAGSSFLDTSSLNEASPVRRGECVEFQQHSTGWQSTTRMYWTPLSYRGAEDLIEDPQTAALAMHSAIKAATAGLARMHRSLLLRLSGGLDSSIVAGCLKGTTERFTAYTYFSPIGRSDERPWARLAATHAGCEHIEYPLHALDLDLTLGLRMPPSPEPSPLLGFIQRNTIEREMIERTQATALFSGDGGDSGFCSDSLTYAVPEFLRQHGITPRLFRLASQVALLTEKSSWTVLTTAVRRVVANHNTGVPRDRILAASQLVSPEIKQAFSGHDSVSHPWFRDQRRVPWDKIRRIGTLMMAPDYYGVAVPADAPVPEVVSPLYSQPVIELLLRIPIHTHFHRGRDRGLARVAFVAETPEPILRRLWKDRAPGFHDQLLERERPFLKETLLDGVLARHGLLDRPLLEEVLSAGPTKNTVYPGEIFRHLDSELWARHWLGGSQLQPS
ncbi:asparagine synthase-related protein [Steroidobacter cummioxidans]|uniref:asparagine synthase-related protein n=1 Tax=Steroidobacter cummioxidans TaxID=1803913 RepID=UPI000E313C2B|nr:asparagine synthase-related protein [Steroidobacter cummioxidans]